MEEVDKIIIHSLKEIGCEVDDEIQSLREFPTNLIIEASVKCLDIVCPGLGIPTQLPQNLASRFHIGSSIAEACKNLGYNGEIGYQTFLYSNDTEVRRVFMFLIEKLPKEAEKSIIEPDDPITRLKNEIGNLIRYQLSERIKPHTSENIPFLSKKLKSGITLPGQKMNCTPQEWREFCIGELKFVTEQVRPQHLLPSIIALNDHGLLGNVEPISKYDIQKTHPSVQRGEALKESKFPETWLTMREKMLFATLEKRTDSLHRNDEEVVLEKEEDVSGLESEEEEKQKESKEIETLKVNLEELRHSIETISNKILKAQEKCKTEEANVTDKIKEFEVRRKALSLLNESELNLTKLEEMIKTATKRLLVLAEEWEKHRKPLISKYRELRKKVTYNMSENEKEMETMRELKEKLQSLNKDITSKKSMKVKLEEEYLKLPKDINRSAYTRRILEIIGNMKKQQEEINKVLKDTKQFQKDINMDTGRLDRSFTVTDEVIYRNAKKDESSKRAYKLLVTLHSDCSDIVGMVEETGSIVREIRVLEEQIEVEKSKNISDNLERIRADLQQMDLETEMLKNQLKILQST